MSDTTPDKYVCKYFRCMFTGTLDKFLAAPDPFNEGGTLYACPNCRTTDDVVRACDELGCGEPTSCGIPVDDERRYLNLCSDHGLPLLRKLMGKSP